MALSAVSFLEGVLRKPECGARDHQALEPFADGNCPFYTKTLTLGKGRSGQFRKLEYMIHGFGDIDIDVSSSMVHSGPSKPFF